MSCPNIGAAWWTAGARRVCIAGGPCPAWDCDGPSLWKRRRHHCRTPDEYGAQWRRTIRKPF